MDREESTNWSEEVVDQENKDLGVGRSYECVFCKRGFNTAQALGGHMNIHRKDRPRNKPNSTNHQPPPLSPSRKPQYHHHPHFPPAASNNSTFYQSNHSGRHQPSDLLADHPDWRMRLSLEFAPSIVEDDGRGMEQEKELDLELRLGYDS